MAGDWIKMRGNLWDDPRVARLVDLTDTSEALVIGGLYWLWATADQHTEDGCLPGLTLRQIDRKTGIAGFGAALVDVGWIHDNPQGVVIVKFTEHNGTSAKRRSVEAQRKAGVRKLSARNADTTPTDSGQDADEKRGIAELEIEEEIEKSSEAKASGGKPPVDNSEAESKRRLWVDAGTWLTLNGMEVGEAKEFINTLAKDYASVVAATLREAMKTEAPALVRPFTLGIAKRLSGERRTESLTVPSDDDKRTADYLAKQSAHVATAPPASLVDIRTAILARKLQA